MPYELLRKIVSQGEKSRCLRVFAQAKTSTFLSLQITAAAGIWNARAGASTTSCRCVFIASLPASLTFKPEHIDARKHEAGNVFDAEHAGAGVVRRIRLGNLISCVV